MPTGSGVSGELLIITFAAVLLPTPFTVAEFTNGIPKIAVNPTPGCIEIAPFKSVG